MAQDKSISFEVGPDEMIALRSENAELRRALDRSKEAEEKLSVQYKQKCEAVSELQGKIKFLEGQIDAYQYCMNCHR